MHCSGHTLICIFAEKSHMRIKEFGHDDRPREKLMEKGARALSNAELTAILIRTGSGRYNAVDTARMLLNSAGNSLVALSTMSREQMCRTCGIGPDKAVTVAAAFELGRRCSAEKSTLHRISVTGPEMIFDIMNPVMNGLRHEECWVIYLNRANYVIGKEMVSSGGLDATVIDVKIIVKKALEMLASGIILVHNHPSGNPRPGVNDVKYTEVLKKAAGTFDISLLDHIVMTDSAFYSFADECVIQRGK